MWATAPTSLAWRITVPLSRPFSSRFAGFRMTSMLTRRDLTRLERAGDATADAKQALQLYEQLQAAHMADRTRLFRELSMSRPSQR